MTPKRRFLLGGGGALMPVFISLLAIDLAATLDSDIHWTSGEILGSAIRYIILFLLGGTVAYLHDDESKPFKLFELGIAAPALITSLVTAQVLDFGVKPVEQSSAMENFSNSEYSSIAMDNAKMDVLVIHLVRAAAAQSSTTSTRKPDATSKGTKVGTFIRDIIRGVSGQVYKDKDTASKKKAKASDSD